VAIRIEIPDQQVQFAVDSQDVRRQSREEFGFESGLVEAIKAGAEVGQLALDLPDGGEFGRAMFLPGYFLAESHHGHSGVVWSLQAGTRHDLLHSRKCH
jgi:hypothetical protein